MYEKSDPATLYPVFYNVPTCRHTLTPTTPAQHSPLFREVPRCTLAQTRPHRETYLTKNMQFPVSVPGHNEQHSHSKGKCFRFEFAVKVQLTDVASITLLHFLSN